MAQSPLLASDRRTQIHSWLVERGSLRSAQVAAELGVSIVTIRRDLADLERDGVADLVYGGARLAGGRVPPGDRRERSGVEVAAKAAIARMAAAQVNSGEVIYLDSGTTCAALVPHLARFERLTVVTNDLTTAVDLVSQAPHLTVVMAGGVVDGTTLSSVGELVPLAVASFVFDVVFVSASAWEIHAGATTGDLAYAATKRSVLSRAKRSFLLVDASKFGASEPYVVRALSDFDAVLTDASLSPVHSREIADGGVELLVTEF